jgi:predicted metal-dependent hydrolase
LRISPQKGLELIVPRNSSKQKAINFLNERLDWIKKHQHLLSPERRQITIPQTFHLPTINEEWTVHYSPKQTKGLKVNRATCGLFLAQDIAPEEAVALLKSWLIKKAKQHLPALLQECSAKHHLPFGGISIRLQRSRWGSCSHDKNISLNCKLLMLPLEITNYILVHELCHTVHLNHSPRFWRKVEQIVPNYRQLCTELKVIEDSFPGWLR